MTTTEDGLTYVSKTNAYLLTCACVTVPSLCMTSWYPGSHDIIRNGNIRLPEYRDVITINYYVLRQRCIDCQLYIRWLGSIREYWVRKPVLSMSANEIPSVKELADQIVSVTRVWWGGKVLLQKKGKKYIWINWIQNKPVCLHFRLRFHLVISIGFLKASV